MRIVEVCYMCRERRLGECDPEVNPLIDQSAETPRRTLRLVINAAVLQQNVSAQSDWKVL